MSGVHRLLSRRDKKRPSSSVNGDKDKEQNSILSTGRRHSVSQRTQYLGDVFVNHDDRAKRLDKEEERKIKGVGERLHHFGIDSINQANIEYALRTKNVHGDGEAAYRLVMLLQETYEGLVKPYDPSTRLLGAENRESVTCYLDSLLFAMFARLDSFEALLYDSFEDVHRRRLAGLLRLWVNMLRTGRLIPTDITKNVQEALAACGWPDAARLRQQDPSEAFTFITDKLELPLLTLKMDLYHTGKEDPQDDHKFVNERLLEVAMLDQPVEGRTIITLEDCLENYFNNRIEVKRHLENQRRNTLKSATIDGWQEKMMGEKLEATHVEVVEIESPYTPIMESPLADASLSAANASKNPLDKLRPVSNRKRADSIFSQRKVEMDHPPESSTVEEMDKSPIEHTKMRKLSTRTEVLMPAWQFFKLLPWYTDHLPESDAQVAAHFSRKRPVLGICLKRYAFTKEGQATRRNTYVDIPLEIAVPNFVSDDSMHDEGPLAGNFRLMLQSVVCHRGVSVHSGHYICLCRGTADGARGQRSASTNNISLDGDEPEDPWMRFDDLAKERITYVDIHEALRQETPYLLFYQVQPIGDDGRSLHDLPSYAEATSRSHSEAHPVEKPFSEADCLSTGASPQNETKEFAVQSPRTSLDVSDALRGRGRSSFSDERRASVVDDTSLSLAGSVRTDQTGSLPSTPMEEKPSSFLAVANLINARRGSRHGKHDSRSRSRPTSTGAEDAGVREAGGLRFSLRDLNMSKLTQRISRTNDQGVAASQSPSLTNVSSAATELDAPAYTETDSRGDSAAILPETKESATVMNGINDGETTPQAKSGWKVPKGKETGRHEGWRQRRHTEERECVVM